MNVNDFISDMPAFSLYQAKNTGDSDYPYIH